MKDFDMSKLPVLDLEAGMVTSGSVEALNGGVRVLIHEAISAAIGAML